MGIYDVTARKAHQWTMVVLVAVGFVLGAPWGALPLALAGGIMLLGRFWWPADVVRQFLMRAWNARRLRGVLTASNANATPFWESLGEAPDGRATLVMFSTPACAACHTAQAPAVRVVEQRLGASEVRVIRVDAAQRPEVA